VDIGLCPPAEVDIARARTTADRDIPMAGQAIDLDMSTHTHHTQVRVPALPMAEDVLAVVVEDPAAIMAVVDGPVVVAVVDVPAAAITVTSSYGERATPREWPFLRLQSL
jgi:hypothetical protein